MKLALIALLLAAAAAPAGAGPKLEGATESIPRNAMSSGGGRATGTGLVLHHSAAEPAASVSTGSSGLRLETGLWPLVAQPGTVTSIAAVSKATGTLELTWTAPGRDGFLGAVTSGYYRIDASSDALHVFAPTRYVTEFSTSVDPGSAQSYTVTGLLPNTTYYTRIYLADAGRMVAETSRQSEESTLAHPPASPALSAVFPSSVTFTWILPAGGAEKFRIHTSTADLGSAFPDGLVVASETPDGVTLSLTLGGLEPETTYYFKLASLNWQGETNFTTVLATRTSTNPVLPPRNLVVTPDPQRRTILLSWTNPAYPDPEGVTIVMSTSPLSATAQQGLAYAPGYAFPDGAVVRSTDTKSFHLEASLRLETTHYFRLWSRNTRQNYSVAVTTTLVLDLPPMAPGGLAGLSFDGNTMTINWSPITSNIDGTAFGSSTAPRAAELQSFQIYRSTGIMRANWVWVSSAAIDATSFSCANPVANQVYYYKVVGNDLYNGNRGDTAMAVDTLGNVYAVSSDQVSRLMIPKALAGILAPSGNITGQPLLIRAYERSSEVGGRVVKAVRFDPMIVPQNKRVEDFKLAGSGAQTVLHYDVANGNVVAGAAPDQIAALLSPPPSPLLPSISNSDAATSLGMYWFNGLDYIKLYGQVDPTGQTVTINSGLVGDFQIRTLVRDAAFSFDLSGISNKALTPNGDGLNDSVIFTFDNPRDSSVNGKVYDMRGAFVAQMRPGPVAGTTLLWDGKSEGRTVPRGVYIYQIKAEDKTFNGTVVVIR